MSNPILTKNFVAEGAIQAHRIVKHGVESGGVLLAGAATDAILGVSTELPAEEGERCDVHLVGLVEIEFGGTVSRGEPVTSDSNGKAVKADPAAGASANVVGVAHVDAVAGDIGVVLLAPSVLKTPAG